MKSLDMADKYEHYVPDPFPEADLWDKDPYSDDEVTVRIQVPEFVPQIKIPGLEHRNFGLYAALTFGILAVFLPAYYVAIYLFFR